MDLPPALGDGLDQIVSAYLAAHGIDEPVTWQPDPGLVACPPASLASVAPEPPLPARTAANWRIHQQLALTLTTDVLAEQLSHGRSRRQLALDTGYSRQAITRHIKAIGLPVPACGRRPEPIDAKRLTRCYPIDQAAARLTTE